MGISRIWKKIIQYFIYSLRVSSTNQQFSYCFMVRFNPKPMMNWPISNSNKTWFFIKISSNFEHFTNKTIFFWFFFHLPEVLFTAIYSSQRLLLLLTLWRINNVRKLHWKTKHKECKKKLSKRMRSKIFYYFAHLLVCRIELNEKN